MSKIAEILEAWSQVKADKAEARRCLENTGLGESPWHPDAKKEWDARRMKLSSLLLDAMPEIAPLLAPEPVALEWAQWDESDSSQGIKSQEICGNYYDVTDCRASFCNHCDVQTIGRFDTIELAKAACAAHHKVRFDEMRGLTTKTNRP